MSLSTSRQRGPLKLLSIENNRDVNKHELESYIYIYTIIYIHTFAMVQKTQNESTVEGMLSVVVKPWMLV